MRRCADVKGDFDGIEEGRVGEGGVAGAEVGRGFEGEDVGAGLERVAFEEGRVAAAIGVCSGFDDQGACAAMEQAHKHSGSRNSLRSVQNVSR